MFKKRETQTHDFTRRYWGHDYVIYKVIDGGMQLQASGWGYGIKQGDYLLLPNGADSTRYQVVEINYKRNPKDQWFATLAFVPRDAAPAPESEAE